MRRSNWTALAIGLCLVVAAVVLFSGARPTIPIVTAASGSIAAPAPEVDEPVSAGVTSETAVLAGGCFWGVQGVFEHVKGVTRAESGYAGGDAQTANYETVSTGDARDFARHYHLTYPLVHAGGSSIYHRWGLSGFPETVIIDSRGRVVHHFPGEVSAADVEQQLKPLLGNA